MNFQSAFKIFDKINNFYYISKVVKIIKKTMRALHQFFLSFCLLHSSLTMASEPLNDEVPPLQSQSQSAVALSGPEHVDLAQRYYLEGNPEQAMHHWNKALGSGHHFLLQDSKYLPLYVSSLMETDQKDKAYVVWNIFYGELPLPTEPVWLKEYAQCALDLHCFKEALDLITLYTQNGGTSDEKSLVIYAQSHSILNNSKEAFTYWEELFNLISIEKTHPGFLFNAAQDFHVMENYKMAAKCMDHALEILPIAPTPDIHAMAARSYLCSNNHKKSVEQWRIFLNHPESQIEPGYYYLVAAAFHGMGEYTQARDFFNQYLSSTQDSEIYVLPIFALGVIHVRLGDLEQALTMFDRTLVASKRQKDHLKNFPQEWFSTAIMLYIYRNDFQKAQSFLKLYASLHQHPQENRQSRVHRPQRAHQSQAPIIRPSQAKNIQSIHTHLKQVEESRCNHLQISLLKLDFSKLNDAENQDSKKSYLLEELRKISSTLATLKHNPSLDQDKPENKQNALITLQSKISEIENEYNTLKENFNNLQNLKRKARVRAFYEQHKDDESDLVSFTPSPTNLRCLYGHEKPVNDVSTQATITTTTTTLPQKEAPLPQISFFQLKNIEKDLITLKGIPGMGDKYDMFLAEIKQDPTGVSFSSGRAKALVGEKGIYSRRFDKANRLVYRVTKQDDGSFHVVILSVLGHYNDLESNMEKSRQEKAPQQAHNKPKKKNTKRKGKK